MLLRLLLKDYFKKYFYLSLIIKNKIIFYDCFLYIVWLWVGIIVW